MWQHTLFGNEVDVGVQFTRAKQVGNLCATVEGSVENTQSAPTADTCVQHGCLHIGSLSLGQLVVMLYLHRQRSVCANGGQLDVGRVGHVEITIEINCTDACIMNTAF